VKRDKNHVLRITFDVLLLAGSAVIYAAVLERCIGQGGPVFYVSPILRSLGVRHAFSTRCGGISPAPFDSLNLGNPNACVVQDDYARIWENYRLLLMEMDCPADRPLRVHQVHDANVAEVKTGESFDTATMADAIVSEDDARPISVRVADCLPVLVSSRDGKTVAAIHAGWRGIVAGVIPAAIQRLRARRPMLNGSDFAAAIGPCIGYEAFEVGPEVIERFRTVFGKQAPVRQLANGYGRVDLAAAARMHLRDAGVAENSIDQTDRCTVTHREDFFSHRRDNGVTGRMSAIILANAA
jgi:YfiH family protein